MATDTKSLADVLPSCSICSLEFDSSRLPYRIKDCGHIFHESCILEWFTRKLECPECRCPTLKENLQKDFILEAIFNDINIPENEDSNTATKVRTKLVHVYTFFGHPHELVSKQLVVGCICHWCGKLSTENTETFHCETCGDWNLCMDCLYGDYPHEHALKKTKLQDIYPNRNYWSCHHCRKQCSVELEPSFRCQTCRNWNLCERCLLGKSHPHPLRKVAPMITVMASQVKQLWCCSMCGVQGNEDHLHYNCQKCGTWNCCNQCLTSPVHPHLLELVPSSKINPSARHWTCNICNKKQKRNVLMHHCSVCADWNACPVCLSKNLTFVLNNSCKVFTPPTNKFKPPFGFIDLEMWD